MPLSNAVIALLLPMGIPHPPITPPSLSITLQENCSSICPFASTTCDQLVDANGCIRTTCNGTDGSYYQTNFCPNTGGGNGWSDEQYINGTTGCSTYVEIRNGKIRHQSSSGCFWIAGFRTQTISFPRPSKSLT